MNHLNFTCYSSNTKFHSKWVYLILLLLKPYKVLTNKFTFILQNLEQVFICNCVESCTEVKHQKAGNIDFKSKSINKSLAAFISCLSSLVHANFSRLCIFYFFICSPFVHYRRSSETLLIYFTRIGPKFFKEERRRAISSIFRPFIDSKLNRTDIMHNVSVL